MPIFNVASLALGGAGMVSGAMGQAAQSRAQYEQARINQQWSEFEKQLNIERQRGAMGLQEFDRLMGNANLERETLEAQIFGRRNIIDQSQYQTEQLLRASRQAQARQQSSLTSRGAGRGGTAQAIQNQTETDVMNDLARIRTNELNSLEQLEAQRNRQLQQRNMRPATQPPTYIPATPVQSPNTNGMLAGALLGAMGQTIGGFAGWQNAQQPVAPSSPAGNPMSQNPNSGQGMLNFYGLGFNQGGN
jgi:hypothetical protein